jgi:prophage regulatory protein
MPRGRKPAQRSAVPNTGRHVELWRVDAVVVFTGLSRSTLQRMVDRGEFPQARRISRRIIGWIAAEVEEWALNLPVA